MDNVSTTSYVYKGDKDKAQNYRDIADKWLNVLDKSMEYGDLKQGAITRTLTDGTVITCKNTFGVKTATIESPGTKQEKVSKKVIEEEISIGWPDYMADYIFIFIDTFGPDVNNDVILYEENGSTLKNVHVFNHYFPYNYYKSGIGYSLNALWDFDGVSSGVYYFCYSGIRNYDDTIFPIQSTPVTTTLYSEGYDISIPTYSNVIVNEPHYWQSTTVSTLNTKYLSNSGESYTIVVDYQIGLTLTIECLHTHYASGLSSSTSDSVVTQIQTNLDEEGNYILNEYSSLVATGSGSSASNDTYVITYTFGGLVNDAYSYTIMHLTGNGWSRYDSYSKHRYYLGGPGYFDDWITVYNNGTHVSGTSSYDNKSINGSRPYNCGGELINMLACSYSDLTDYDVSLVYVNGLYLLYYYVSTFSGTAIGNVGLANSQDVLKFKTSNSGTETIITGRKSVEYCTSLYDITYENNFNEFPSDINYFIYTSQTFPKKYTDDVIQQDNLILAYITTKDKLRCVFIKNGYDCGITLSQYYNSLDDYGILNPVTGVYQKSLAIFPVWDIKKVDVDSAYVSSNNIYLLPIPTSKY